MTILEGLHVIEVSGNGAAALAAKHFADWGARVTILEPAGGTPLRQEPPYYELDGERRSATWEWLSRGKTSVRVGSEGPLSASDALELCKRADAVLIESELTESVLGLAPAQLREHFEGTTTCLLISPFAADGPYARYRAGDLGISALGGWMAVLGDPGREPLRPGGGLVARVTGIYALLAALVGLRHVRQGAAAPFIDLSAQAVAASMVSAPWLVKSMAGFDYERTGNRWPLGVMECADGYVGIPPLTGAHWELLCQLLGLEDVLEHPKGRDPAYRARHGDELYERVRPWLRERTRGQVFEEAQAWRLPAAPVQTIDERLACPQLEARGFWRDIEIDGRVVKTPRVPYRVSGLSAIEREPHIEAGSVDLGEARGATGRSNGAPPPPFEGVRVLDLTSFWSGPYATSLLGSLGADVMKVESAQRPDPYRYTLVPRAKERWYEWSPVWNDCNCDKRGITLDLTSSAGSALLERLVRRADIVISNFANRVMPNLGLTNERLLSMNPRVIAVTMPGYGADGPWGEYVGYAIPFEQLICGSMTGYADGAPSYAAGFCDPLVGIHAVAAIELALQERERTGKGVEVEIPQCEVLDSLFAPEQIAVQMGAPVPARRGNKHEWMAPHDAYATAGDDEWITIAVGSDEEFSRLAGVLGQPDLAHDARFATAPGRKQHEAALDESISAAVAGRESVELERALQDAGVMGCRVVKAYRLAEDAGLRHAGFLQTITREATGAHTFKTWPFRFSSIDVSHKRPPPHLGEHNIEVLGGELGLSDEEIGRLKDEHVIGWEPLALAD